MTDHHSLEKRLRALAQADKAVMATLKHFIPGVETDSEVQQAYQLYAQKLAQGEKTEEAKLDLNVAVKNYLWDHAPSGINDGVVLEVTDKVIKTFGKQAAPVASRKSAER